MSYAAFAAQQQSSDRCAEEDCKWFRRAGLAVIWIVAALNGLLRYYGML